MTASPRQCDWVELPRPLSKERGRAICEQLTLEHKVTSYITHHQDRSYVRLCGQLYNTPDDYQRLVAALGSMLDS
jgi:hypothetical protein